MLQPLRSTTCRTLGELRAATADLPDTMPVQTDSSLSVIVQHCPAEPATGEYDPSPERVEINLPYVLEDAIVEIDDEI